MKKENAPIQGRQDCVAGARNLTAIHDRTQSRKKQTANLVQWLLVHKSISTPQAHDDLGVMHPTGRVEELRDAGWTIETFWQWDTDATGKRHKQGLYVLMSDIGSVK
jgi:hypothetical protein